MKKLIDTHCHVFTEEFDQDREQVIKRAVEAGVCRLCLPNISPETLDPMLGVCDAHPSLCFPMIGLHPTDLSDDFHSQLDFLEQRLMEDCAPEGLHRYIGIGETGLDLHWDSSRISDQIESFLIQAGWAVKYGLPLVVHARDAFDELCEVMNCFRYSNLTGIFHCFSGTEQEVVSLSQYKGFMFGIGGTLTYKKSVLPQSLKRIPLDRIVLETDSPYLAPVPHRGARNESAYLTYVVSSLALVYGCSEDEIADVTTSNAARLFGFNLP